MKKPKTIFTTIIHLFIIAIIFSIIFIYYFNKVLGPELIKCAENQTKQLTTTIMNNSIKKFNNDNNINSILNITKNKKEEIIHIHYNTKKLNYLTTNLTEILEKDLRNMTKGNFNKIDLKLNSLTEDYYEKINNGIIFTIPIASSTNNRLLANIGPKIPLKLKLVGNVNTKIDTKIKEYGLNNALIEIYVTATSNTIIQMPFLSKKIKTSIKLPISIEIIQGTLPEYYLPSNK